MDLLKKSLKASKVNSVDAFQGQEREVVVMSLVRNNDEGMESESDLIYLLV